MPKPQRGAVRAHQPGQDVFKSVLSEDVDWKPFDEFPPSVRLAVIVVNCEGTAPDATAASPAAAIPMVDGGRMLGPARNGAI